MNLRLAIGQNNPIRALVPTALDMRILTIFILFIFLQTDFINAANLIDLKTRQLKISTRQCLFPF